VFNGSTSLRDAAGQLIENVAKSVRRKETVDDAYIDGLYSDITSLYRLDQTNAAVSGRQELGSLPTTSVVLLSALGLAWVLIILYVIVNFARTKRR
jgi:multiple sugar transport system substrate-binding protein